MLKKKRVVVAMSGGVDSCVAAALLKNKGYEAIGITMCFNLAESSGKHPNCCGRQGIDDAARACHTLGIKHYVVNMQKTLENHVIEDFCREYLRGRTPNPCVRCNQYVKFGALLKKALSLDAQFLATGHYARIDEGRGTRDEGRGCVLKKAKDKRKDQSYFLYRLAQEQLKHILFPLGNYTKVEVRGLARKFHLAVAEKPGSQEVCFLPDFDYRRFLSGRPEARQIKPGVVLDSKGKIIGRHKGVAFYTIGQREGLGIALGYPAYITKIDPCNNIIIVGTKEDACNREFLVSQPHFILKTIKKKIVVKVRIRYNHKETPAEVIPQADKFRVCFRKPEFAVTPGQSAVFYGRNTVLGGGIIEKVLF